MVIIVCEWACEIILCWSEWKKESIVAVSIDAENCVGCRACVDTCPAGALDVNADNIAEVNADECVDCGACVDSCPSEAIAL